MKQIDDSKVFKDFVSPNICRDIMCAGFTPQVNYFWRGETKDDLELISFLFDLDDYYKDAYRAIDYVCKPAFILAAFTINDLEQHMPEYCICKDAQRNYEIMVDDKYEVASAKSSRLPDAFGQMMINLVKKRVIDVRQFAKSNT